MCVCPVLSKGVCISAMHVYALAAAQRSRHQCTILCVMHSSGNTV